MKNFKILLVILLTLSCGYKNVLYSASPDNVPTVKLNDLARFYFGNLEVSYPFSFCVAGDIQIYYYNGGFVGGDFVGEFLSSIDDYNNNPNNNDIDFVIMLGDITNSATEQEYNEYYTKVYAWMINTQIPVFTLPGNHDINTVNATSIDRYHAYIDTELDYTFDFGNSRFVLLNNVYPDFPEITMDQVNKVDEWLTGAPVNRFTFYHVPFSKKHTESWESHGANIDCNDTMHNYGYRDVHELHKKHKIRACFTGHSHDYFYDKNNLTDNINYFVTGCAGYGCYSSWGTKPFLIADGDKSFRDYHWLAVDVYSNTDVHVIVDTFGSPDEFVTWPAGVEPSDFNEDLGVFSGSHYNLDITSKKWGKVWTNPGDGLIGGWPVQGGDIFHPGDYDGDGAEELFCVQGTSYPGWLSMKKYYNDDWQWYWSSGGTQHIITPLKNDLIAGDFDGDNKDELMGISLQSGLSKMYDFDNGSWQEGWTNSENGLINTWTINSGDDFYPGDFNGDGRDELLCVQTTTNPGWLSMKRYSNGDWQWYWSSGGGNIILTGYKGTFVVGDYDGDGKDELLGYDESAGLIKIFNFDNGNWNAEWTATSSHALWAYRENLIAGNFDHESKDEVMGFYTAAAKFDYYNSTMNLEWSTSDSKYILDWPLEPASANYLFIKAENNNPEYLIAYRNYCTDYWLNMYAYSENIPRSLLVTDEEVINENKEYLTVSEQVCKVYPNPVNEKLYIMLAYEQEYNIQLLNVNGSVLKEHNFKGTSTEINCSDIPQGQYIIKIKGADFLQTYKIQVVK